MRLNRVQYYSDFVFYPILATAISATALWQSQQRWPTYLIAFAAGVVLWSFGEYILHRYVFHHFPYIRDLHMAHHEDQTALIGTPTWISLAAIAVALLPIWLFADTVTSAGVSTGVIIGYIGYGAMHHILHHWKIEAGHPLYALKRRHALHHHLDDMGNFGVTSGFWDFIFGTDIITNKRRAT